VADPFEALTLEQLRERRSVKWRMYDADVLPLWVAEMDLLPPPTVLDTLTADLRVGDTGYPPMDNAYAEAFARVATRWGWTVDVAATAVCADVVSGVAHAIELVTAPGDGVLLPSPVYPPLAFVPAERGRRVVPVAMTDAGRLDVAAIDVALAADPGIRALLLCSPHNPTGVLHTAEELRAVAAVATEHGVAVVVDEIHQLLVPAGAEFVPWLTVADEGVVVTSASKAYNLAGLKAGLMAFGPGEASRAALARLPQSVRMTPSTFGVRAHVAAWDGGEAWLAQVNAAIVERGRHLGELLASALPDVGYRPPQATYLAWLDCRRLGLGDDPAVAFLRRGRVALNGGPSFGPGGEGFVRLNLACSRAVLEDAVARMASCV